MIKKPQSSSSGGLTYYDTIPISMRCKIPFMLKKIESLLYLSAPSKKAYLDRSSLLGRMKMLYGVLDAYSKKKRVEEALSQMGGARTVKTE